MSNKKLRLARKKIDIVDRSIFNLIKKRTHIVKHMLSLKQFKSQIIDRKRIKVILKNIRNKSLKKNIDTELTKRIWVNMIRAYINFEYRKFKKK